jgi:hypothetical protein
MVKALMGRSGAVSITSLSNIGYGVILEKEVHVLFLYTLNQHGNPLMPCSPRKERTLLKSQKSPANPADMETVKGPEPAVFGKL